MKLVKTGLILALFVAGTSLSACTGATNSNGANSGQSSAANQGSDNANTAKTNVEELGLLINMPFEAEEAVWKDDPAHKKVIAVLRFSPEDSKKLVAEAAKIKAPEKVTLSSETWFPPELIAQGDTSGDDNLDGMTYPANAFFQPPYAEGRIIRIEGTDFFVLEVSAK